MRRATVVGNWKMHGTVESVSVLLEQLSTALTGFDAAQVAVCPPFVFLEQVKRLIETSPIELGAQNLCEHVQGAYTGEISGGMLKELGCRYVIVGHSERRQLYGESNELVATKFAVALEQGLNPILCVGETLSQRESGDTLSIIDEQLSAVIEKVGVKVFSEAIIAYEPVWAIGTGKTATPEEAQAVHLHIRKQIMAADKDKNGEDSEIAAGLSILYGGSIKASNAQALFSQADIDGGLVGGASLAASEFEQICRVFE